MHYHSQKQIFLGINEEWKKERKEGRSKTLTNTFDLSDKQTRKIKTRTEDTRKTMDEHNDAILVVFSIQN